MNDMKTNTLNISLSGNLTDANVVLENGTKISNVPGSFEATMAYSFTAHKASGKFKANLGDDKVEGQFYLNNQGLIVTRETIESVNALDETIFDLKDTDKLPEYLIFPVEESNMAMINKAMTEALNSSAKQNDAVMAFCEEILNIIPDSCYSYSDGNPVLNITLNTFTSQEFVDNLKSHNESIIDKLKAVNESSGSDAALDEETTKGMKTDIKELTPQIISDSLKKVPLTLKTFKITAKSDQINAVIDFGISNNKGSFNFAVQSQEQISTGQSTSKTGMQVKIDQSDLKLTANLDADATTDFKKASCNMALSLNGKSDKDSLSGKGTAKLTMDWSSNTPINIPTLTSQNSKVIKPEPPQYSNEGISVVIDGEDIDFGHVKPIIVNGRTMLPLRELVEYLGCEVEWQPPSTIKIKDYDNSITMNVNSNKYMEGNAAKEMDVAPMIVDGHTYVPVRFIAEYFGYEVEWDPASQTVFLYY